MLVVGGEKKENLRRAEELVVIGNVCGKGMALKVKKNFILCILLSIVLIIGRCRFLSIDQGPKGNRQFIGGIPRPGLALTRLWIAG